MKLGVKFRWIVRVSYRLGYPNLEVRQSLNDALLKRLAGAALKQLRERGYAEKYRASGEPVQLVGVEFSEESRNITTFEIAEA